MHPRRDPEAPPPHALRRLLPALLVLLTAASGCAPTGDAASDAAGPPSFPEGWPYDPATPAVTAENGMVSTTDAYATDVGVEVLRAGGNAVDAAVAVTFALAVVNTEAGNIGGGGFMVSRMADGTEVALDYREKAPLEGTRDMFLDEEGNLTDRSVVGHLASGVPGTVMGMWRAHERFGTLEWADLVQPAVDLAEGYVVRDRQATMFRNSEEGIRRFETTAETFLMEDGQIPQVGDTFRQPELASTLERIRDRGAAGFYEGETADLIVAEMERGGGIISHEDLRQYDVAWRDPVRFDYRDHTLISMPPASSGGATMAEFANILEGWELGGMEWHSADHVHLLAEAWKRAYADRNTYLADTDFVDVPLERMVSEEYAAQRRQGISLESATPSEEVEGGLGPEPAPGSAPDEGRHTTHFSIVDAAGNAVSITTTINSWFGSKVTVEGAGFVLNNEMDDFSAKPGVPNQFGLVEGEANVVEPGKRMLSSMTPTVVLDPAGELFMVTGTPGGSTIITTTFQTIANVVDHGFDVVSTVHAPRVHHQHLPDQIFVEGGGLPPGVVRELESRGHTVTLREGMSGDVQAILVRDDGTLAAASDPRRGGTAAGH